MRSDLFAAPVKGVVCTLTVSASFGVASAQIITNVLPTSGSAPLLTYAVISVQNFTTRGVSLDFGDGATKLWYEGGEALAPFTVFEPHEYNCPGTYIVTISHFDGYTWFPWNANVVVAQPTPLVVTSLVEGSVAFFAITDATKAVADKVVADWGDGSPLEEFRWQQVEYGYISPSHTYAAAGDFRALVTNQYLGPQCGLSQGVSVVVTIENPNPVSPTTWGHVKMLYR